MRFNGDSMGFNGTKHSDLMDYEWDIPSGNVTWPWKDPPSLIGKPTISGPFPMAMLNYQRVPSGNQTWKIPPV